MALDEYLKKSDVIIIHPKRHECLKHILCQFSQYLSRQQHQPADDVTGKVSGSPKSLDFVSWGP